MVDVDMKQRPRQPIKETTDATNYDRDSEAIKPLVPVMPPDKDDPGRERQRDGTDGSMMLDRSQLGHTTEYTWDIEMVEPGVPRL
jgi:hypothetical protein